MNGLICTGLKGNGYELGIRKGIKEQGKELRNTDMNQVVGMGIKEYERELRNMDVNWGSINGNEGIRGRIKEQEVE